MTAALLLSCACALTPGQAYRVVRVVDGNTFEILVSGRAERARLPHTAVPGLVTAAGRQAREALDQLIAGRLVRLDLERDTNDPRDDALLVYPQLGEKNLTLDMVARGWCRYTGGGRYATELALAEINARKAHLALWR